MKVCVRDCDVCKEYSASKTIGKAAPAPSIDLLEPLDCISLDFFETGDGDHLALVDRASSFKEHFKCKNKGTKEVITNIEDWFLKMGFPKNIRTDGGPCFRQMFGDWCKEWGITHDTTSPYSSSSNGMAENCVGSLKHLWKKCKRNKTSFKQALFYHNQSTRPGGRGSPSDIFFRRRRHIGLPSLKEGTPNYEEMQRCREKKQEKDREGRHHLGDNDIFPDGASVWIQDKDKTWSIKGTVVEPRMPKGMDRDKFVPRSYFVQRDSDSKVAIKSRRFIKLRKVSLNLVSMSNSILLANGECLKSILKKSGDKYISRTVESGRLKKSGDEYSQRRFDSRERRSMQADTEQSHVVNSKAKTTLVKSVSFYTQRNRDVGNIHSLSDNKLSKISKGR